MDHIQRLKGLIAKAQKNLEKIQDQSCCKSLKRRVTLQNYKGKNDPRLKNTSRVVQVTLPTDLVDALDKHIVQDTMFNSRREAIEVAIEKLIS